MPQARQKSRLQRWLFTLTPRNWWSVTEATPLLSEETQEMWHVMSLFGYITA